MIRFNSTQITISAAASEGEENRREIMGIAVPYNVAAVVSDGTEVIFEPGSLPVDGKAPRLFMNHDSTQAIGIVTERFWQLTGLNCRWCQCRHLLAQSSQTWPQVSTKSQKKSAILKYRNP